MPLRRAIVRLGSLLLKGIRTMTDERDDPTWDAPADVAPETPPETPETKRARIVLEWKDLRVTVEAAPEEAHALASAIQSLAEHLPKLQEGIGVMLADLIRRIDALEQGYSATPGVDLRSAAHAADELMAKARENETRELERDEATAKGGARVESVSFAPPRGRERPAMPAQGPRFQRTAPPGPSARPSAVRRPDASRQNPNPTAPPNPKRVGEK